VGEALKDRGRAPDRVWEDGGGGTEKEPPPLAHPSFVKQGLPGSRVQKVGRLLERLPLVGQIRARQPLHGLLGDGRREETVFGKVESQVEARSQLADADRPADGRGFGMTRMGGEEGFAPGLLRDAPRLDGGHDVSARLPKGCPPKPRNRAEIGKVEKTNRREKTRERRRGIHRGAVRDEDLFGERLPRQRFEAGAQALGRFVRCDDDGEPHQPERNRKTVRTGFEGTTSRPSDAPTAAFTPRTIGALDGKSFATSPSTDIAASVSTGSQPAATGIAIPCVFQILQDVRAKTRSPFPRNASATPWRPIRGTSAR